MCFFVQTNHTRKELLFLMFKEINLRNHSSLHKLFYSLHGVGNIYDLIFFTIFTIYIRGIIALIAFVAKMKHIQNLGLSKGILLIYACRAVLTLLAQITYTLSTSSPQSSISWVFLNITPLYSVLFGNMILHEKIKWADGVVILLIFVLALIPK